jgi:HEAT repeat protein
MGIIKISNYPEFRRKAVYWLGRWGAPEARELLTETAANDRDASVKAAAVEALTKLKVKSEK